MFERFLNEGAFSASPRQILDASQQSNCDNCERWAKADSECDLYTYNRSSKRCTKLRTLHSHGDILAVITDPIVEPQTGQVIQKPLSLITYDSEFGFDHRYHHTTFETHEKQACNCRQRAANTPGTRFVQYNTREQKCTGISSSSPLEHVTFGVRRGKLKAKAKVDGTKVVINGQLSGLMGSAPPSFNAQQGSPPTQIVIQHQQQQWQGQSPSMATGMSVGMAAGPPQAQQQQQPQQQAQQPIQGQSTGQPSLWQEFINPFGQVQQQQTSATASKDITGQLPVQWPGHLGLNTTAQPTQQPSQQQMAQPAQMAQSPLPCPGCHGQTVAQLQTAQQTQQPEQQQVALPQVASLQQQPNQSNGSTSGSSNPSWIESKPNSRVFFYCMLSLGLFMMLLIVFLILKMMHNNRKAIQQLEMLELGSIDTANAANLASGGAMTGDMFAASGQANQSGAANSYLDQLLAGQTSQASHINQASQTSQAVHTSAQAAASNGSTRSYSDYGTVDSSSNYGNWIDDTDPNQDPEQDF